MAASALRRIELGLATQTYVPQGSCSFLIDGLNLDAAQQVQRALMERGFSIQLLPAGEHRWRFVIAWKARRGEALLT